MFWTSAENWSTKQSPRLGRTRRITRNRIRPVSSLWASRHGRSVANAPRVAFVRTSSSNPQLALGQIRKTRHKAGSVVFGRTGRMVFNRHCIWRLNPAGTCALLRWSKHSYGRVCRTADLYHVKADWPHQDTRGHPETSLEIIDSQAGRLALT